MKAKASAGCLFTSLPDVWEPSGQEDALLRFPALAAVAFGTQNKELLEAACIAATDDDENKFIRDKMGSYWRAMIGE